MIAFRRSPRPSKCLKASPVDEYVQTAVRLERGVFASVQSRPRPELAKGCGPKAALDKLRLLDLGVHDRMVWLEGARLDAVLGGRRDMPALRSGLKCYIAFVGALCALF